MVEPGEIDTDDHVRLAFEREQKKLIEDALELAVLFQGVEQSDHGVLRHFHSQLDARFGHLRTARAEEFRWKWHRLGFRRLFHRLDQFGRQQIPAGFARDEHETLGIHFSVFPRLILFAESAW